MSLTISGLQDMLRNQNIAGNSTFTISGQGNNAEVKKTGFFHAVKTFFGFKSAKAQNAATLNAIRVAIMNDDSMALGYTKALDLLKGVKGTITAAKMQQILSSVRNVAANPLQNPHERQKSLANVAVARLAANTTAQSLPFLDNVKVSYLKKDVVDAYALDIGNAVKTAKCGDLARMNEVIEKGTQLYNAMFEAVDVADHTLLAQALANCHGNTIITPDGDGGMKLKTADECKQFATDMVKLLKGIDVDRDKNQRQLVFAMLGRMHGSSPVTVSPNCIRGLINIGREIDTTEVSSLFDKIIDGGRDPEDFPRPPALTKALGNVYAKVKSALDNNPDYANASTEGKGEIERFVFEIAINSMEQRREALLGLAFVKDFSLNDFNSVSNAAFTNNQKKALKSLTMPLLFDTGVNIERSAKVQIKTIKIDITRPNGANEMPRGSLLPDE